MSRHFVSPSVNDPPFSSVSAANCGLSSFRNVTQLRSALRVVRREQISSGTTVDSHPFFFSLYPFIAFFAIEDVEPDSLCLPFLPNRLSGSPPVTLRIANVRVIALFSGMMVSTDPRFSCAWWRPSRELDAPVPSMTSRSGGCSGSSTLVSGSLLVPGSLDSLFSVASDLDSFFRLFLEFVLNPFTTAPRVVCRVPNSCPNATATQTLG